MSGAPLRIHVLEGDPELEASLVAVLRDAGHIVTTGAPPGSEVNVVLIGLPAPAGLSPGQLPDLPLVLLTTWRPYGEVRAWIEGHRHWSLLPKPVRKEALLDAVASLHRGRALPNGRLFEA